MTCQACAKLFYWNCQVQFIFVKYYVFQSTYGSINIYGEIKQYINIKFAIYKLKIYVINKVKYVIYNQENLVKYQWRYWYWKG